MELVRGKGRFRILGFSARENWVMRRALFVVPIDRAGGAERVISLLAKELSLAEDWDVEIAVLAGPTPSFFGGRVGTARVSYGVGGGHLGSEWRLLARLRRSRYDLVFSSHIRMNAFLAACHRVGWLRCKRFVTRESTIFAKRYGGLRLMAYRALYSVYGSQDLIIAQTGEMKAALENVTPCRAFDRVSVLGNPIDAVEVASMAEQAIATDFEERTANTPYIVWCGRMVEVKRPLLAIDTLHEIVRTTGKKVVLVMIGSGPLQAEAEGYAASLELSDQVIFAGQLQNPFPIMKGARYGLLTSSHEGFPNVLIEMMACGVKRIVTTPCSGDLDTLAGVVVAESSKESLAKALLEDHDALKTLEGYHAAISKRSVKLYLSYVVQGESPVVKQISEAVPS
ncbi:glycosyltransferase [Mesorhizobium sp. M0189]|uniref:glycosyltransferase n=2 Tax=Mesorhizobium TaxID=68287 RepID=UPI00333B9638